MSVDLGLSLNVDLSLRLRLARLGCDREYCRVDKGMPNGWLLDSENMAMKGRQSSETR